VAVLTHVAQADPVAAYRHSLILIVAFFVAAGLTAAVLLTGRPARPEALAATPGGLQPAGRAGLRAGLPADRAGLRADRAGLPADRARRPAGHPGLRDFGSEATTRS